MDILPLCHKVVYEHQYLKDRGAFCPMPLTPNYTACSVNATPNLGRYGASLEAVPLPSTGKRTACIVRKGHMAHHE